MPLWQTVVDLEADAEILRRRRYGVIEMKDQQLKAIHLRPYPRIINATGVVILRGRIYNLTEGDCCWLFYNQPLRFSNFLVLKYVVSSRAATLRTFRGALVVLDEIARLKQSDALLSEVVNQRISERLLDRWGWERHVQSSRRRHYIKRFYGQYPASDAARRLASGRPSK